MQDVDINTGQEDQAPKELYFGFAKRHHILLDQDNSPATILHTAKTPLSALIEIRRYMDAPLTFKEVTEEAFNAGLVKNYEADATTTMQAVADLDDDLDMYGTAEALQKAEDLLESEDDAPIIKLINAILGQALKDGASDIHIETYEDSLAVRFRIDGVLQKVLEPNRRLAPLLVSRVKVMAKLDISEKRVPQDGRIAVRIGGRAVDVRVSTMPSSHGERVVMRILEKDSSQLDLAQLGLSDDSFDTLQALIKKPHGILLVTGPTGAGKTTTLYAALSALNESTRNILTVEDPVEYEIPGIGQTQVNTKVGMTFAKGLRAILRQDPDVVMVGEIRDIETAEIAIQASLTGHLVLSTLHTNTAIGAITRLRDMGVERFLLSTSVIGVIGQRLVRLLCNKCKQPFEPTESERALLNLEENETVTLYEAIGCVDCNRLGYDGRTGIYEIIAVDEGLKTLIHEGGSEQALKAHANEHYATMRQDGLRRVRLGETTLEEVMRVTTEG